MKSVLWDVMQTTEFYDFTLGDDSNVLISSFCKYAKPVCDLGLHMISDIDPTTDSSLDYYYFAHFPSPTSSKNMVNFGQIIDNGLELGEFD